MRGKHEQYEKETQLLLAMIIFSIIDFLFLTSSHVYYDTTGMFDYAVAHQVIQIDFDPISSHGMQNNDPFIVFIFRS